MALLVELRRTIVSRGARCELVNVPESVRSLVHLYRGDRAPQEKPAPPAKPGPITQLGMVTESLVRRVHEPVEFLGRLSEGIGHVVRRPGRGNWRSMPGLLEHAGADAIAIVVVLDFLIGFVIGLQSMQQLRAFGANIYVADLVGISATRELVPLMTAIIMCGRSGAAIAAELGTMRVSEEVDALETMGISPIPHLVLPRVLTLAIVAPMLVLLGDAAALAGGLVVGVTSLDLTAQGYISELRTVLVPSDIWTGLVKGAVFGMTIAVVGCQEGLAARGAAAGVGRRTTATVVTSLFLLVTLDTLLTMLFREAGV
jgi:phospholipid/cholesterol/gamma-HCH transport system permease protein